VFVEGVNADNDMMTIANSQTADGDNITVTNISKSVGSAKLLSGISFSIGKGECFGVLGENGSGKTTILRIMAGLLKPTSGSVEIMGNSPHTAPELALKNLCGFIGIPAFYPQITAYDNLRICTDTKDKLSRCEIISQLDLLGLADDADKKVKDFSRGMLQRLGIVSALLENRQFIVMDEPTQGVDDIWVEKILEIFKEKIKGGQTFIISSHNFDFIVEICNNTLILESGKTAYLGELKKMAEYPYYFHLDCDPIDKTVEILLKCEFVHKARKSGNCIEVVMPKEKSGELIKKLIALDCTVNELALRHYCVSDLVLKSRQKEVVS